MNITKNTSMIIALLAALFTIAAWGTHVFAQETDRRRHGPPPEAYTACEGKNAGDAAEFVSPRGDTVTGTCEQRGDRLVLCPDNLKKNSGGPNRSSRSTGRQNQGPPPEAYTACEGKSAGDTAEFVSPRGDSVKGTCEQEGDRLILRPDTPQNRRGMNDDGAATSYAMVDTHQIAFYNSSDELVIRLTERDPNGEVGQAEDPQSGDTDTLVGPVDDDVAGLIWQQVSGNSKYSLADATAYPGLLPLDGGNDLRLYSLTKSFSTSEFESGSPYIDSTRYTLGSFEETEKQYWYSNFDDLGTSHEGIDSEYSVNFFTIDTQGSITGISRIVPDIFH